jgi:hypothetical protein
MVLFLVLSIITAQGEGYIDSTKIRNPKLAWKLSVIPGMGQLYNGKYLKAAAFMGTEYFAVTNFIELRDSGSQIGLRNTYAWWVFGLFVWNMLDAYVDAHLSTFPVKKLQSPTVLDSLKTLE